MARTPKVTNALESQRAEFIEWISGGNTLRDWAREKGCSPTTVYAWVNSDAELIERFARAREAGEEILSQECLEIADNATNDWMEAHSEEAGNAGWKLNGEHIQRSKLRIETRLKLLAKWNPKKWGEKQAIEHSGNIGLEALIAGNE